MALFVKTEKYPKNMLELGKSRESILNDHKICLEKCFEITHLILGKCPVALKLCLIYMLS
jgi:hypothetical protein